MLMQILTWIAVLLFFINLYKSFVNAPNFLQLQLEACAHAGFVGNSHLQQQYVRQCRKAVGRYEEMYKYVLYMNYTINVVLRNKMMREVYHLVYLYARHITLWNTN